MTIKVEQDTLLQVLQNHHQHQSFEPVGPQEDYLVIDFCKPIGSDDFCVEKLRSPTDDEDDSVYTISTASLSDTFSDVDSTCERRVSFAENLVTDVWTRPFTPKEEISDLYYSTMETQRFRQEYRLVRKLLNELSIDPETCPTDNDGLSALISTSQPTARHSISRVVVLHNNKLETFFEPKTAPKKEFTEDFFDNDSFWSGSITWY
ncbi:predicted protein [Phaeodactylum tricornutum CCAP 1055/1]|jgi:hypothetical protein|uniref:Uncharacterized protein n=1 Tax=Phaeodactylum tricornutum (strain CCAP 1055/1) TaxID=556484 RepID=B7FXD5_PHATC|nr:predicted protein [Phaeodactylum tricornutum CCAP 1055/1]EEC49359.1 predicted protein [Phaeodactylum tricornutum CCAP 1055/1]|eukprot:XP_002179536.1 predicted protein [Phaeodactylum tricornutum CCAP 1055/1]